MLKYQFLKRPQIFSLARKVIEARLIFRRNIVGEFWTITEVFFLTSTLQHLFLSLKAIWAILLSSSTLPRQTCRNLIQALSRKEQNRSLLHNSNLLPKKRLLKALVNYLLLRLWQG